jgi:hypothetical protein
MNVREQCATFQRLRTILVAIIAEANIFFKEDPQWKGRSGGYFCLADGKTGEPICSPSQVGPVNPEKARKYYELSEEKARRLAEHLDHQSSYQSRNPDAGQWGGAVRISDDFIFSLSGYPELGDEALMLILADNYYTSSSASAIVRDIARGNGNPYLEPLFKHIQGQEPEFENVLG